MSSWSRMFSKDEKSELPSAGKDAVRSRVPGWASLQSTSAFRAVTLELFARPNKVGMGVGATLFLGSLGYMGYINLTDDKHKSSYVTIDENGGLTPRTRPVSKWA